MTNTDTNHYCDEKAFAYSRIFSLSIPNILSLLFPAKFKPESPRPQALVLWPEPQAVFCPFCLYRRP
jgi:hypothetical protein